MLNTYPRILLASMILLLAACGGSVTEDVAPTATATQPEPQLPVRGEWTATTDFGEMILEVGPGGASIPSIKFVMQDFPCGEWNFGGDLELQREPPWDIEEYSFTIESTLDPFGEVTITVNGVFDLTGTSVSGTWVAQASGEICSSGQWSADAP
jgi:hypothetical protein